MIEQHQLARHNLHCDNTKTNFVILSCVISADLEHAYLLESYVHLILVRVILLYACN